MKSNMDSPTRPQKSRENSAFSFTPISGTRNEDQFARASRNLRRSVPDLEGEEERMIGNRLWKRPIVAKEGMTVISGTFDSQDDEVLVEAPNSTNAPIQEFQTGYSGNLEYHTGVAVDSMEDYVEELEKEHTHHFECRFNEQLPGDSLARGQTPEQLADGDYSQGLFLDQIIREFSDAGFEWVLIVTIAEETKFAYARNQLKNRYLNDEIFPKFGGLVETGDIIGNAVRDSFQPNDDESKEYIEHKPGEFIDDSHKDTRIGALDADTNYGFNINIRGYAKVPDELESEYQDFLDSIAQTAELAMPLQNVTVEIREDPTYPDKITADDGDYPVRGAVHHQAKKLPGGFPRVGHLRESMRLDGITWPTRLNSGTSSHSLTTIQSRRSNNPRQVTMILAH